MKPKMKAKSRIPDKARQKTDSILTDMERQMGRIYDNDPALVAVEDEYEAYMRHVSDLVEASYSDFIHAKGKEYEKEAKEVYLGQIRRYTIESDTYNKIIHKFVHILAQVNQKAIDVVNDRMPEIYVINYNAVADQCRKAGIKVNDGSGKKRAE